MAVWLRVALCVERSRGSLAHVKPKLNDARRPAIGTDLARATKISELRAALSLRCGAAAQASGSSAKASSSPPPNTTTTPPNTTHPLTHPPLLLDSPISTSSQPPTSSTTALDYPYHVNTCARPYHARLQHRPTTRRRTRSLHITNHGSVVENACCCPRNGWRRRCSSAGKSCFFILCRNTMVLACPCLSLRAHMQSTIRMPKELSISILGFWLATSCLATKWPMRCGCLKPALLLLVGKHGVIATEATLVFAVCISIHGASKTTYATHHNLKHAEETKEARPIPVRGGQLQRTDNVLRRKHGLTSIPASTSRTSRNPRACGPRYQT